MDDRDLRQDTTFMLILIAVIGLAYGLLTSESAQKRIFVSECSDTYTEEWCASFWEMRND